jgi:hypothetical protein
LNSLPVTTKKNIGIRNGARKVAATMPPITAVPISFSLSDPAPLASASGSTPSTKAIDVMRIGRSRIWRLDGRVEQRSALLVQLARELDDEDRVLRRQADRRQQPDLEVHAVGLADSVAASSAPSTPIGTTRITEIGIDQLSYSAARLGRRRRPTARRRTAPASPPAAAAASAGPLEADRARQLLPSASIASIAWPVLLPGGACPISSIADTPL